MRKTFLSVFLAILAAVAVIGLVAALAWPVIRYNRAKSICFAEIASALSRKHRGSTDSQLASIDHTFERVKDAELTLLNVYARKPYGLPLTAEERKSIKSIKERHRQEDLRSIKAALEMHKTEYGMHPFGSREDILAQLKGDNTKKFQFYTGPTDDYQGKPYPVSVEEIDAALGEASSR